MLKEEELILIDKPFQYPTKLFNGRAKWCHLWTNGDLSELHQFALKLGLKAEWFQCANRKVPHYDIVLSKRKLAIKYGAIEMSMHLYLRKDFRDKEAPCPSNNFNPLPTIKEPYCQSDGHYMCQYCIYFDKKSHDEIVKGEIL